MLSIHRLRSLFMRIHKASGDGWDTTMFTSLMSDTAVNKLCVPSCICRMRCRTTKEGLTMQGQRLPDMFDDPRRYC